MENDEPSGISMTTTAAGLSDIDHKPEVVAAAAATAAAAAAAAYLYRVSVSCQQQHVAII